VHPHQTSLEKLTKRPLGKTAPPNAPKKSEKDYAGLGAAINFAVFPGLQGGPHNHTIAALATALKQAQAPEYKAYQHQVVKNSISFATKLQSLGYVLVSGGTDNHLCLVDCKKSKGIDGARVEAVMELANVALNKNTVPGDTSALSPGGVRMGAPALTTRGFSEKDFDKVAEFFDAGVGIAMAIKAKGGMLKDFKAHLHTDEFAPSIAALKDQVSAFARTFPTVGFE